MTQEQIEIETQNYLNGLYLPENADKQLIVDNFKNGMAWALLMFNEEKQQWIEKACEYLDSVDWCEAGDWIWISKKEFIDDFKKAMEE